MSENMQWSAINTDRRRNKTRNKHRFTTNAVEHAIKHRRIRRCKTSHKITCICNKLFWLQLQRFSPTSHTITCNILLWLQLKRLSPSGPCLGMDPHYPPDDGPLQLNNYIINIIYANYSIANATTITMATYSTIFLLLWLPITLSSPFIRLMTQLENKMAMFTCPQPDKTGSSVYKYRLYMIRVVKFNNFNNRIYHSLQVQWDRLMWAS